ncbi:hypothetical protein IDH44_23780 [Paenibacillus sp. IB182496]|uniref:Glycosyl-4,4'-diaponeurosporenoate acyltransferase n=1 Tax=Paenibacillus sabuli TaxID=2772509 RepID=A0A927BYH0_9BACL|nr:hypothetical protein [Paenibacillus sabuli]MBD2848226.1 hypothetical protein [Paenibacillus sabuli]
MRLLELAPGWTILLNILGWLTVQLGAAWLCQQLPAHWFACGAAGRADPQAARNRSASPRREDDSPAAPDGFASREERFYARFLRIRAWKHRLPDGARLLRGGFAKRELCMRDVAYYRRFVAETRRAELTHWLAMAPAPLFFLWNAPAAGCIMLVYALAVNLPCIAAQRYNRIRLHRLIRTRRRKK